MRETEILRRLTKAKQNCFQAGMVPSRLDELRARAAAEKDPRRKAAIESGIRDAELEEAEAAKRAPVPAKTPAATPVQTLPAPQPTMPVQPVSAPQPTLRGAAETLRGRSAESMGKKYGFERGTPFVEAPRGVSKDGDHVPAMLEHGEAVLPKATVAAVGAKSIQRLIEETTGRSPKQGLRGGLRAATGAVDFDVGSAKPFSRVDIPTSAPTPVYSAGQATGEALKSGATKAYQGIKNAGAAGMAKALPVVTEGVMTAADKDYRDFYSSSDVPLSSKLSLGARQALRTAGSVVGGTFGAGAGSVVPVAGTVAGGMAGGVAGYKLADEGAKAVGLGAGFDEFRAQREAEQAAQRTAEMAARPKPLPTGEDGKPVSAEDVVKNTIRDSMNSGDMEKARRAADILSAMNKDKADAAAAAIKTAVPAAQKPAPTNLRQAMWQPSSSQPEVVQRVDTPSPFTEAGKAGSWDSLWEAKRQARRSDALNKANAEAFNAGSARRNAEAYAYSAGINPVLSRERMQSEEKIAANRLEAEKERRLVEDRRTEALNKKTLADENRADRKEQAGVEKDMFKATDEGGKEVFDAAKYGRFLQFKSRFDAQGTPHKGAGELKRMFDAHEAQLAAANKGRGSVAMTGEPMTLRKDAAKLMDIGKGGLWWPWGSTVYRGNTPGGSEIVIDPAELPDTPEMHDYLAAQGLVAARKQR